MFFLFANFGPQSWAPAVGYCVFDLPVNFRPQGFPRLLGTTRDSWALAVGRCVCFLSIDFGRQGFRGTPRDSWAPAVGYCVFSLSLNSGIPRDSQGFLGSSCWVLSVLFFCLFRPQGFPGTPSDSWAPAVGYCMFLLSVSGLRDSQRLRRIPGIQVVCSFCLPISSLKDSQGLPGIPGLQLLGIVCFFVCQFRGPGIPRDAQGLPGIPGLQLVFVCQFRASGIPRDSQGFTGSSRRVLCFFCLSISSLWRSQGLPGTPWASWAPAVGSCVLFVYRFRRIKDSQGLQRIPAL